MLSPMAFLRRRADGKRIPVPSRLVVGRAPSCTLRLDSSLASSEHASLSWNGEAWELRDLGSKNGTYLDKERVEPGRVLEVSRGDMITFGDRAEEWDLQDAGAPELLAVDLESNALIPSEAGLLALPSADQLEASVFRSGEGTFVVESADGDVRDVESEEVVRTASGAYRLFLPVESEGTPMVERAHLAEIALRFEVSRDEEHVGITVLHRNRRIALEPREHGYLLLTLARGRSAERDLPPAQRGWIDREELERMLAIDENTLNVWIYRARQQLLERGIEGAQGIVEVRPGKRRLGTDRFEVVSA
jgi:hypothetical protein